MAIALLLLPPVVPLARVVDVVLHLVAATRDEAFNRQLVLAAFFIFSIG